MEINLQSAFGATQSRNVIQKCEDEAIFIALRLIDWPISDVIEVNLVHQSENTGSPIRSAIVFPTESNLPPVSGLLLPLSYRQYQRDSSEIAIFAIYHS
jgi:hypothetical protein